MIPTTSTKKQRVTVDLQDVTWVCGDCKNLYDHTVEYCPNTLLDEWAVQSKVLRK